MSRRNINSNSGIFRKNGVNYVYNDEGNLPMIATTGSGMEDIKEVVKAEKIAAKAAEKEVKKEQKKEEKIKESVQDAMTRLFETLRVMKEKDETK